MDGQDLKGKKERVFHLEGMCKDILGKENLENAGN